MDIRDGVAACNIARCALGAGPQTPPTSLSRPFAARAAHGSGGIVSGSQGETEKLLRLFRSIALMDVRDNLPGFPRISVIGSIALVATELFC